MVMGNDDVGVALSACLMFLNTMVMGNFARGFLTLTTPEFLNTMVMGNQLAFRDEPASREGS